MTQIIDWFIAHVHIIYFCIGSILFYNALIFWVHKKVPRKIRLALTIVLMTLGMLFFNGGGKVMTEYEDSWTTSTLFFAFVVPVVFIYLTKVLLDYFKSLNS